MREDLTQDDADLVSIIIVAHNDWPDLELAIESALNQSYAPVEVIIVDNGSTDSTEEILSHRYSGLLRYVKQQNTFDAGGYNRGFAEAKGSFIQFLDGDDFIAPNKVAKQMKVFAAIPDADIAYGDIRCFQGGTGQNYWKDADAAEYEDMLDAILRQKAEIVIHSLLYRRRALEKVGPWDEQILGADHDYFLRAAAAGCRFVYSPDALCFQRRRAGQMSADKLAMLKRMDQTLDKALSYITSEEHRSVLLRRWASVRLGNARVQPQLDRPARLRLWRSVMESEASPQNRRLLLSTFLLISIPGALSAMNSNVVKTVRAKIRSALRG